MIRIMADNNRYDYNSVLDQNRIAMNKVLNKVLWLCILTGPAIAVGVFAGVFPEADYSTCLLIFVITLILASFHTFLVKKFPTSIYTSLHILLSMDLLLLLMSCSRIYINITWFFVPFLSILFCSIRIFLSTVAINFCFIILSVCLTAPYYISVRNDYATSVQYISNVLGGYTIETVIMAAVGFYICKIIINYLKYIYNENNTIKEHETQISHNQIS